MMQVKKYMIPTYTNCSRVKSYSKIQILAVLYSYSFNEHDLSEKKKGTIQIEDGKNANCNASNGYIDTVL